MHKATNMGAEQSQIMILQKVLGIFAEYFELFWHPHIIEDHQLSAMQFEEN